MRKSSQNNRSALMTAGENSLGYPYQQSYLYNDNQNLYKNQQKSKKELNNLNKDQNLSESNVRQIYKRQIQKQYERNNYNTNNNNSNIKFNNNNNSQYLNNNKNNKDYHSAYHKNTNQVNSLQLQTKQFNNNSPIKNQMYSNCNRPCPFTEAELKKLMIKLTLTRLRKIQGLVRGFLFRRKVYPRLLQQYLIGKSVLSLIQSNVIYKQISSIIMQTITFPKYQRQQNIRDLYMGYQRQLQQSIYQLIISNLIKKQLHPIVQQSIINKGLLVSRPMITYGFNLRDPLELLMYERLIEYMKYELKLTCEESIKQQAEEKRELFIVSEWIEKYCMLDKLYEEIANQLLEENVAEYVGEDIMGNMLKEAVFVIANGEYNRAVNQWYQKIYQEIKEEVKELLLQGAVGQALVQLGYGIENLQYKPNQIIQHVPLDSITPKNQNNSQLRQNQQQQQIYPQDLQNNQNITKSKPSSSLKK